MKVIKKGRPQQGWSSEFKCTGNGNGGGGCGAILLVSEYDIYETTSHALGETDFHQTFCCSECGIETDIPESKWAPNAQGKRPTEKERKEIALKNKKK